MENKITPSFKAPAIDALLSEIVFNGKDRPTCIREGICITCDDAKGIKATSFRDDISRKEYAISAMCQSCQDDVFGHEEPDEPEDEDYDEGIHSEQFDRDGWDDEAALGSAGFGMDETYF